MTDLQRALAQVLRVDEDFAALIEAIYAQKFTGAIILHCTEGVPKIVEFPGVQVRLLAPALTAARNSSMLSST